MLNVPINKINTEQVLIRNLKDVEGGFLPLDSAVEGTGKFPLSKLAKSQSLAEEITNRRQADVELKNKDHLLEADINTLKSQVSKLHSALKFKGEKSLEDLKNNTFNSEVGDMYTITDGGDIICMKFIKNVWKENYTSTSVWLVHALKMCLYNLSRSSKLVLKL